MKAPMFCFQCEQTAGCVGCQGRAGVCGKSAEVAGLQDALTGALIGVARAAKGGEALDGAVADMLIRGLFTTVTNVNFNPETVRALVAEAHAIRDRLGGAEDYDVSQIWACADADVRSLKSLILFGLRGMAAYAFHAAALGRRDPEVGRCLAKALVAIGEEPGTEALLALALEVGRVNLACMALLDAANTEAYGQPKPVSVPLTIEKGPFIIVTGHDLHDLRLLLEQTEGKGINIYTHGEMLPAHGYPELKRFPHLKGNFGTAWQNQQREFDGVPAPILFTTNCLMPPRPSYLDRVFTTALVSYPGVTHIGPDKDFAPVIAKALALGGYVEAQPLRGINGGDAVTTGFGRDAILAAAPQIVQAVKDGAIRRFFLVGGCDGAKPGRNYYTEFVRRLPQDTVVLTLACGKYRFNDLDLGTVAGLPRLLDVGQCNDAYGAIRVALVLADAFGCGVNDLPLSFILSWYEQKAVCILLTLLHLGIRGIRLGPSLPAFLSPNILNYLVEHYAIAPITTPEQDIAAILG